MVIVVVIVVERDSERERERKTESVVLGQSSCIELFKKKQKQKKHPSKILPICFVSFQKKLNTDPY